MKSPETLLISKSAAGVAQVTMSRPAVFNAFDETMIAELDAAFDQLGNDASVRLIVLAGAGKHFSAGADLQWMQRASSATAEWNLADARRFAAMLERIQSCLKPTLARVQGAALGGGVGLICACDIAIAGAGATFGQPEINIGILPGDGATQRLTRVAGKSLAMLMILTGEPIDAAAALRSGLVAEVVETPPSPSRMARSSPPATPI